MRIACPHCGPRAQIEFAFGQAQEAALWPQSVAALTARTNPRGRSSELWQHVHGCRGWIVVERDTLTHEISATHAVEAS